MNTGNISVRGYELGYTPEQVKNVCSWVGVFASSSISAIAHRCINLTTSFPSRWTSAQKILAPQVALWNIETVRLNRLYNRSIEQGEPEQFALNKCCRYFFHNVITLKTIQRFNTYKDFIPDVVFKGGLEDNTTYSNLQGLIWAELVRDYIPPKLVDTAKALIEDEAKHNHRFTFDSMKTLINSYSSGDTYTDNEIAQALYHNGINVKASVSKTLAERQKNLIYAGTRPELPDRYFINVKYDVRWET